MDYNYTEERAKRASNIAKDLHGMYMNLYRQDTENSIIAEKNKSPLLHIYKQRRRETLGRLGACTSVGRILSVPSKEKWEEFLTYIDIHIWKEGERIQATMAKEILALAISAEC